MAKKSKNESISIEYCASIEFPENVDGNLLIYGNFRGIFGMPHGDPEVLYNWAKDMPKGPMQTNVYRNWDRFITHVLDNNHEVLFLGDNATIEYYTMFVKALMKEGMLGERDTLLQDLKNIRTGKSDCMNKLNNNMKRNNFAHIIQNPPYNGILHLDFFKNGLDLLKEDGKMTIIEPATWLINIRSNGNAVKYDEIKKRVEGHVEKVVIENMNGEFGTEIQIPFSTTVIDLSNTFESIDLRVFGEHRTVRTLDDCNLVGSKQMILGILDKVSTYRDTMKDHIFKDVVPNAWYTRFSDFATGNSGTLCSRVERHYDTIFADNGQYKGYLKCFMQTANNSISLEPFKKSNGEYDLMVYGTKDEMENWQHFIFNNKLPSFIGICLTIDQNNNSKQFMPWLVDKQYTDEEINQMFGFTEDEIRFIDRTLKKYERQSPWFRRYICGPDSATDQEVMDFLNAL